MQLKHKDKQEGFLGIFRFGALSQIAEIAKLSENIRRKHDQVASHASVLVELVPKMRYSLDRDLSTEQPLSMHLMNNMA